MYNISIQVILSCCLLMNRKSRKLLFWSWFPVIPAAAVVGAIIRMQQSMDPIFWQDRVFIQAPLVILPILAIWVVAVPRLLKLRAITKQILAKSDAGGEIEPSVYQRAASPGLIIPFQMSALGALTGFYFALVP